MTEWQMTFDEVVDYVAPRLLISREEVADRFLAGWSYQQSDPGGDVWITPTGSRFPAEVRIDELLR